MYGSLRDVRFDVVVWSNGSVWGTAYVGGVASSQNPHIRAVWVNANSAFCVTLQFHDVTYTLANENLAPHWANRACGLFKRTRLVLHGYPSELSLS